MCIKVSVRPLSIFNKNVWCKMLKTIIYNYVPIQELLINSSVFLLEPPFKTCNWYTDRTRIFEKFSSFEKKKDLGL